MPSDFVYSTPYFDPQILNNVVGGENTICLPQCHVTEYQMKISKGKLEPRLISEASNISNPEAFNNPEYVNFAFLHENEYSNCTTVPPVIMFSSISSYN